MVLNLLRKALGFLFLVLLEVPMNIRFGLCLLVSATVFGASVVSAQGFRSSVGTTSSALAVSPDDFWNKKTPSVKATQNTSSQGVDKTQSSVKPASSSKPSPSKASTANQTSAETKAPEKETVNTGLPWNETTDKTQRGNVGLYQQNSSFTEDSSFIFLYYDNFYVNRSMSGEVRCFMRFILTSTLDRKINNLSVKLRWPEMETALNFYDVSPNVDTYFNYSLMGEGCYSMDKIPNIIVNRCRVAKMSAKECASKIRWLRKN